MKKRLKHIHNTWIFYILLTLGASISVYYSIHQIISGDQTQMLYKGYLAARSNIWLNYGNGASAMGNVPGSLSTLLIALPLKVIDSPYSPMILLLLLRLIGFLMFYSIIKRIFSSSIQLCFLLFCWLNPWFQFESLLYNPSYLFFCSALHFWSAYHLKNQPSLLHSFLHVLSIGLALQLHYSWPLLAVISTFLFIKRYIFINWIGVFLATSLVTVSLLPYIFEVSHNTSLLSNQDPEANARYIGWGGVHVYPVLKSFLYWLRYASFLFPNKILTGANFNYLAEHHNLQLLLIYFWRGITFSIGCVTVFFSAIANYYCWQKVKHDFFILKQPSIKNNEIWLINYAAAAVVAVIISATLSPIILIYWHLMLVFPFALFPILIFIKNNEKKWFNTPWFAGFILTYFLFVNVVAVNDSKKFTYGADYYQQTLTFLQQNNL
jgi:hypothetical protein